MAVNFNNYIDAYDTGRADGITHALHLLESKLGEDDCEEMQFLCDHCGVIEEMIDLLKGNLK